MTVRKKKIVQILISATLIVTLLYWMDLDQLKTSIADADYVFLIYAFALILFNRILMPVKWNLLLRSIDIGISWYEVIKIYFISSFLGVFLPPTVGGDIVRAYYVHKKRHELSGIISSIVIERLIGLIALLVFGVAGCLILVNQLTNVTFDLTNILLMSVGIIVVVTGGFIISLHKRFGQVLISRLDNLKDIKVLGKVSKFIIKFYDSYTMFKTRKKILLIFFVLTCVEVSLPIIRGYLIAVALHVNVPLLYFFAFVPIILMLIRLPISFDGFGINEGGFVYFLSLVGISTSAAFSVGIINHFIFLIALLPGGVLYAFNKSKKGSQLFSEAAR